MLKMTLVVSVVVTAFPAGAGDVSPYAGEENRQIKSMSAQEIEALARGDGMGFAKAAELNRYPGPKHVLELAAELELSAEQAQRTSALFDAMQTAAVAAGNRLIAAEAELDRQFAAGTVDRASLQAQLDVIGELRSRLRFVHLEAHLRQKEILIRHQVAQYARLRGYHGGHDGHH